MNVRKSTDFLEEFDKQKVKDGICKAYEAAGEECDELLLESIANSLFLYDNISSSEIRRQVEDALMSINKKVAKEYSKNYNDSVPRKKKNDFIQAYIHASNAATGSKYDSNANVSSKNIVTLGQELYKEDNIKQNRYILFDKIRKLYSKKLAEQYIYDLESHVLYKHDESGTPGYPYCVAITMYPFLVDGLKGLGGESVAPTDLKSFCGEFINLVYSISSQFMGACMYKDQHIIIKEENGCVRNVSANDFIESNMLNPTTFENYQGVWEYAPIKGIKVFEDGKFVDLKKVYRRKYCDDIYVIRTKSGYEAKVSKDHVFKQLYKGREFETKASNLTLGDTVFMSKDFSSAIDFNSDDYKNGWIKGMLCGDGSIKEENSVTLSVNYGQEYFGDIFNEYSKELYNVELNKNKGHKCFSYAKYNKEYYNNVCEDIIGSSTYDKHIEINGKSYDYLFGFLDGLFCADGSYSETHGISISLTNEELSKNIHDICEFVGIKTNISKHSGKGNRKDYYTQYVQSRILKYLKHVNKKVLEKERTSNTKKSRDEVYYYGRNAFYKSSTNIRNLFSSSKKDELLKTDVIESIEVFVNDCDYVYEIETETHWYNCGGFLTHNCATPEFLMYMDYFIRKDYGGDYVYRVDEIVDLSVKKRTIGDVIDNAFQQVVHSMNMPAGNRGYQSVFWNISYFDKPYFEGVFGDFEFPDGTKPVWETLSWLQKRFMKWFNKERLTYTFTFPVETMALLTDGSDDFMDKEYADFTAQMWSEGHSFFCYLSDSPDSLSSCCRLRNSLKDLDNSDEDHNHTTHQYSMGTASVATGSKSVMTMNLPRLIQNATRRYFDDEYGVTFEDGKNVKEMGLEYEKDELYSYIKEEILSMTERIHKYQTAFNDTIKDFLEANMLDVYRAGFIDMKKQYLTVGVNGITDAAEFLGIKVSNNEEYREFVNNILETINISNRKDKTRDCMFNTEFVPAENLAAKNYKWDKKDGYWVSPNRNLYSSYFYNPEDETITILEKLKLHGKGFVDYLDGGSAFHCNLSEHLSQEQYRQFMKAAAKNGCNYFTFNVKNTVCNDCGFISKQTLKECPHCGSKNLDYLTRVIGYLKRVSSFSEPRQDEEHKRFYA